MEDDRFLKEPPYRLLVEGIVDVAIFMLEPDGTVASWNRGAQRIKGYASTEIIGQHFSAFYSAEERERGEPERVLGIAREHGTFEGEGWRVRKDGSRFWASVVVDALRGPDDELLGFAKVTRDTTERSMLEEQRHLIVDAAPNGMLVVNADGLITLANAQAERLFGYRTGTLVGSSIERLLSGAAIDRSIAVSASRAAEQGGGRSHRFAQEELVGHRFDGSSFPVEVTFNATPTAHGPVTVASVADITERRAFEQQRQRWETALVNTNRLMTIAEKLAMYGHWRYDLASRKVVWSDEVLRTHGWPPDARPTMEAALATFDPDGVDVGDIIRRATLDGEPFAFESRVRRTDGTLRDVRTAGCGERDAQGNLVAIVGVEKDITADKEAERERNRLIERMTLATHAGRVGIWEWDVTSDSISWDANMFALYGLSDRTMPSLSFDHWCALLDPSDRKRTAGHVRAALGGAEPLDTEFRIVWPDGQIRILRTQGTVLRDPTGKPVRMVGLNWDITDVRSLADRLREDKERESALERERLYENERKWSTTFQRAVLPLALPTVPGFQFDAVYEPGLDDGQVGGDWYDAVHLLDGRVLVAIGDVSGNGLEAAVVVGVVRQIMRGISQLHADPTLILDAADRALRLEYPNVYVSAWVGIVDLVTRRLTYASAGHPPPLVVSRDGKVRSLDDPTTMLIGLREGFRGRVNVADIEQGDMFVLYTDGVTEARRDLLAGDHSLRLAAASLANESSRRPADAIRRFVIPEGSFDDVAILVVRTDAREAERFIDRWRFNALDPGLAAAARSKLIDSLEQRGFGPVDIANAELVFSELIGNVVRHAPLTQDVDVIADHGGSHSVLHVLDQGAGFHHISRLPPEPLAENGRGLFLIGALALDFSVSERPEGGSHARVVLRGGTRTREDARLSAFS